MEIASVAVIGGGTMGAGIAALAADAGCRVLVLDRDRAAVDRAMARVAAERERRDEGGEGGAIATGSFDELDRIAGYDWVCEAVIEHLETKRELFARLEAARSDGSIVSTNTSGIPLRAIVAGLGPRLAGDVVVTHFFNPVKAMKLMELVAGERTRPEAVAAMAAFASEKLGKGVVHAKDTVNFIANRIGCFWMLSGLHKARRARRDGLAMERIDALMAAPMGLPATGLYGLIDLIGLDVMAFVARNLAANLPAGDAGHAFTAFPPEEQAMLERGQLGRKAGGGFYRVTKGEDGSRVKEAFDLDSGAWRQAAKPVLAEGHATAAALLAAQDGEGAFARDLMGGTLAYAASLVPEISDDIVNIDRAMRWGFAWRRGPFELLDALGPARIAAAWEAEGRPVPALLRHAAAAGGFYRDGGREQLAPDGSWRPVPPVGAAAG